MHIEIVSCDSVILRYGTHIDESLLDRVQHDFLKLYGVEGFIEVVPSYASIWVRFDTTRYTLKSIQTKILSQLSLASGRREDTSTILHEIPVDYTQGLDLERIAAFAKLSVEDVITLHMECTYRVYAIGFMVGFAYLGKVDARIAMPRLDTPRHKVPKGAVAIANEQTAVYPKESAGGWNIVGVMAFEDFEKFKIGDRIRFVRI